jgi:hypothetical protein
MTFEGFPQRAREGIGQLVVEGEGIPHKGIECVRDAYLGKQKFW